MAVKPIELERNVIHRRFGPEINFGDFCFSDTAVIPRPKDEALLLAYLWIGRLFLHNLEVVY